MIVRSALSQLWSDVRSQKLRTFLTAFGIVWGTASVSLLLAFGQGLHRQVLANSSGLGENIVIAWPSRTSVPFQGLGKGRPLRLTEEDMDLLRSEARGLDAVSGERNESLPLVLGARTIPTDVRGVGPDYGPLRNLFPAPGGRFLNPPDFEGKRRVVFLGDALARDLFGAEDPVGRGLQIGGSPFTVVGVLRAKQQESSYSGPDESKAFIPATTFEALTGRRNVENFVFRAKDPAATTALRDEVISVLARRHRFDPADREVLMTWDTTEGLQVVRTILLGFRVFLAGIGALTLLVGGIGVSNIMSVVVEERTHEIGIRMALGARPRGILLQLLLETLLLTFAGGVLGIGLSATICAVFPAFGVTQYVGTPVISPGVAALTAIVLGAVALAAGWFPAREAARLDPVRAMRT